MIRKITSKDLSKFIYFCQTPDNFGDFYITKDNKRLFLTDIKTAKKVFDDCLRHNEKCYIKEEKNEIKALLLVVGYRDKFERKYVKVLAQSKQDFQDLFNYLVWQDLRDLFIKVQKKNYYFVKYDEKIKQFKPSYALRKNGFKIIAVRENEVLLKRENEPNKYSSIKIFNKDKDE